MRFFFITSIASSVFLNPLAVYANSPVFDHNHNIILDDRDNPWNLVEVTDIYGSPVSKPAVVVCDRAMALTMTVYQWRLEATLDPSLYGNTTPRHALAEELMSYNTKSVLFNAYALALGRRLAGDMNFMFLPGDALFYTGMHIFAAQVDEPSNISVDEDPKYLDYLIDQAWAAYDHDVINCAVEAMGGPTVEISNSYVKTYFNREKLPEIPPEGIPNAAQAAALIEDARRRAEFDAQIEELRQEDLEATARSNRLENEENARISAEDYNTHRRNQEQENGESAKFQAELEEWEAEQIADQLEATRQAQREETERRAKAAKDLGN